MTTRQKRPLSAIKYIVIHHTASADAYSTHETLAAHQKATGFGYHATVDDDAALKNKAAGKDGAATWKQQTPLDEVDLAVQILAAWAKKLGWRKADVGRIVTHNHVGLHISPTRYVTECPGHALIAMMLAIRSRVASYLPE